MRDIVALLFGTVQERGPGQGREACVPGDTRGWDCPPVPTGDWCQTSPGEGTLEWLGLKLGSLGPQGRTRRGYSPRTRTR